jgi:hypothetical protein
MPAVRSAHLKALEPYFSGELPRDNGEIDIFCPLHEDTKRSASMNVKTGEWYCFAGCGGGEVSDLIRQKSDWVSPSTAASNGHGGRHQEPAETITNAMISGWASALQANVDDALDYMAGYRGLQPEILKRYDIGWDVDRSVYTIPVYDADDDLVVLRRYNPRPKGDRRKMWGVRGMNSPHLFPLDQLSGDPIIICGGEWDALTTIQAGFPTITRTAAERVWNNEWSKLFAGKKVYLCHDADSTGRQANRRVARALDKICDVHVINLPYKVEKKHGKDLSDFFMDFAPEDFENLIETAVPALKRRSEYEDADEPETITVLDSFDSRRVGEPVKLYVTIKGKREPGYSVPRKAKLTCTQDAGKQCQFCPMLAADGEAVVDIMPDNPAVLELIEAASPQVIETVRHIYGAQKCNRLEVEPTEHQAIETLYARPSIEHVQGEMGDYKNMKLVSVGRHNTPPNNTVEALGALYPNPRNQANEFLAWEISQLETTIDNFEMTDEVMVELRRFQPGRRQRPLAKMVEISRELSKSVTKIYGRPEMHVMMDLVWHSAISFWFRDEEVSRGWLDALVLGDTRTGKSEAARRFARHYSAGEVINCEAASLAGVVGGLQQYGSGREWAVSWGAIPINDRRLVVLDEVSGLSPEAISQMSDVRSSGTAKLTKIQQEVTFARTRLLWLSNPRNARMADYTFGVQALAPLIGNAEDIARFDLVCAVAVGDVPSEEINKPHTVEDPKYDADACRQLVHWAWSRTADDIQWSPGAEDSVYAAALAMGKKYVENPPLIQAANARIKIARVAVAMALRLFSTSDGETVIVTKDHVKDAVAFMDRLYGMPTLGYATKSSDQLRSTDRAEKNRAATIKYLRGRRGLVSFLRGSNSFRRQDVEEVLNMSREEANAVVNSLWEYKMIRKEKGDIRVEPTLHDLLRRVK